MKFILARIFTALVLCAGAIATTMSARAAEVTDTITANYLLQCQKDQNACQVFTNNAVRVLAQSRKACAPNPVSRDDTNKLVQWILTRPQQSTGHANDDIAMAASALWPCK